MREEEILRLIKEPVTEVLWGTGYTVTGINIKVKSDSVLLMVKAHGQLGHKKICFLEAADVWTVWSLLASACYTTSFKLEWRDDKW